MRENQIEAVIERIVTVNDELARFWGSCHGWAGDAASEVLARARLDRQGALSRSLLLWQRPPADARAMDGHLVLAWTNLGALVEGTMKLFLAVYMHDYMQAPKRRRDRTVDVERLKFEEMRQFFAEKDLLKPRWLRWIGAMQEKRNAIHPFMQREVATLGAVHRGIRRYERLLSLIVSNLPSPDEWEQG